MSRTLAYDLRCTLSDPRLLCEALGLGTEARDRKGPRDRPLVRCPRHGGVSCSVTRGKDGTVRVRCFGCDLSGDALHLVAEVYGLDIRWRFAEVLRAAAEVARRVDVLEELGRAARAGGGAIFTRTRAATQPSVSHPPGAEVRAFWGTCGMCTEDSEVSALLENRSIRPEVVDQLELARVLPMDADVPGWARFRGSRARSVPWTESGHRLILPVYDATGRMRSVRAWRIHESEDPKRLPPAGYSARSLVLACPRGVALLATTRGSEAGSRQLRVIVVEGEPDFLTWATRYSDAVDDAPAVLGITSGTWIADFAQRIPIGARVIVRTHADGPGEAYAEVVRQSLEGRCDVWRSRVA